MLRLEKEEKRRKEKEEEDMANLTPEQRTAEKLRLKKIQEESDLKIGLETLGLSPNASTSIESFNPSTKEEFAEFADAISRTVSQFKTKLEYGSFVDDLVRNLCAGLSSTNIRRVKTSVENLYLEKQKLEKGDKPKKKPAAKVKATLRMEGDVSFLKRLEKN
jgi:translation initiation factor 3 subunit J